MIKKEKNERKRSKLFVALKEEMEAFSKKIKKIFHWRDISRIDYDQVFDMALLTNIRRYEEGNNSSFKNYCYTDIKMTIVDEVNKYRSVLKIPTRTARKVYMVKQADWFNLSDEEVQDKYNLTKYEVAGLIDKPFAFYRDVTLEDRHLGEEDEEYELYRETDTEIEGVKDNI